MTQPPNDLPNADWPLDDDEGFTSATAAERMATADWGENADPAQGSAFELPAYDTLDPQAISTSPAVDFTAEPASAEPSIAPVAEDGEEDAIVLPPMLAEFAAEPETAPEQVQLALPEVEPEALEPFTVPEDVQAFFEGWETTLVQIPATPIVDQVAADLNVNIQNLLGVRL